MEKFKEYVKKKIELYKELFERYNEKIFRKLNFYTYMNTQKSENNLIKKIKHMDQQII